MKKIELYDILTLSNGEKYTIISKKSKAERIYAILLEVDEQERPLAKNICIVELVKEETMIKKITDESLLKELTSKLFKDVANELCAINSEL